MKMLNAKLRRGNIDCSLWFPNDWNIFEITNSRLLVF